MNIHRKINRKAYAVSVYGRRLNEGNPHLQKMIKGNYNHPNQDTLPNDRIYL